MTSRERVLLALNHQASDRIPVDFWASTGFLKKLEAGTGLSHEDFLDAHDVDLRYIGGPEYIGPPLQNSRGEATDIWGVPRTFTEVQLDGGAETYAEVTNPPLASISSVEEIISYPHWPSPDWFDYTPIRNQCDEVARKGRLVVFMGDRLNRIAQLKPAMYLRGMEQVLVDMALEATLAEAIFGRIRDFYLAYLERILEAAQGKIDIVLTGDDFGAQDGLLLSVEMWDRFLRAGFAGYLGLIKSYGVKTMHHTCGAVAPLLPRLIASGLDVLQSVQPEARGMDPASLKAGFGARLAFHGGVSIQRTMPHGSRDDIRGEVARLAQTLGPGGGYIFCTAHNLQADTPVANALALLAAYHEFGRG
jgi:uroporphyrinogen decarboxylase